MLRKTKAEHLIFQKLNKISHSKKIFNQNKNKKCNYERAQDLSVKRQLILDNQHDFWEEYIEWRDCRACGSKDGICSCNRFSETKIVKRGLSLFFKNKIQKTKTTEIEEEVKEKPRLKTQIEIQREKDKR